MKSRILDSFFKGNYKDEWLSANSDKIINGQLVSEWQLIEPAYNGNFQTPKWSGSQWIEGATPEEIEAINKAKIPKTVKNMKLRLALIQSGISISSIDLAIQAIEDIPTRESIQTMWEYAEYYERDNAQLTAMASQLGIADEQLDQLFILAETL